MTLYAGIDLHSNNSVIVVQDEQDVVQGQIRLPNQFDKILTWLEPYKERLEGVVVESTYNWYWLVDGLEEAGYAVHLANTVAIQQYDGLKYRDDQSDARWLATLLRLGQLPEGYIYPRKQRALRDLMRKRRQFVRQATMTILSIQNLVSRNTGSKMTANRIKRLTPQGVDEIFQDPNVAISVNTSLATLACLQTQIQLVEEACLKQVRRQRNLGRLQTVPGIGDILALTILLETGDIHRFSDAGHYASYCRLVSSTHVSNGKRKGSGNTRNGNAFLCWAYMEATAHAIRYCETIRTYYQRKQSRTKRVVARKAIAHKLARACFHMLKNGTTFDLERAFQ